MPNDAARPPAGDQGPDDELLENVPHRVAESDIEAWIRERKEAREAEHARRREWLERANGEHKRARAYGLQARHALALNRRRKGTTL